MSSGGSGFSFGQGSSFNFNPTGRETNNPTFDFSSPNNQTFNLNTNPSGRESKTPAFNFSDPNSQPFNFSNSNSRPFNFNSDANRHEPNRSTFNFSGPSAPAFDFTFGAPRAGESSRPAFASTSIPIDLCLDCAKLDLETAFARAHSLYEKARRGKNTRKISSCRSRDGPTYLRDFYFVTSLGTRLSENRGCKLCSFFKQHVDDPKKGTYKVLAICSSELNLFEPPRKTARGKWIERPWQDMEYNVFLTIVPEVAGIPRTGIPLRWLELDLPRKGSIYRLTEDVEGQDGRRLIRPEKLGAKIDDFIMRFWIYTCAHSHGARCSSKKPNRATLRGFRAVDCTRRPLAVRDISWSEKYVALSYVWGSSSEKWPQTIEDAVTVTRMLGFKYLWVDRLCIDQSNPDEQMYLISKMDAIYEGAEITIINAAGDARAGLPGIGQTRRTPQPSVELDLPKGKSAAVAGGEDLYLELLNVPRDEYERETAGHSEWLDTYRHGLNNSMTIDMNELLDDMKRRDRWVIPRDHFDFFEDSARHLGMPFEKFMETQEELARKIGIQLVELVPYLQRQSAEKAGIPIPDNEPLPPLGPPPEPTSVSPSKPEMPLPPGKVPGKTVLVSTMQDPRITIRESRWATRGWTYQEGVLARRCLVFTPQQVYWECRCMAVNESFKLPVPTLHSPDESGLHWAFAPYMLSGVFRGDMHRTPELQYGFPEERDKDDVTEQVKTLDSHIRSFTSRKLTDPGDSWKAFLGVATRYTGKTEGLSLALGIPYWAGLFANGQAALQHSFAMSVSVWYHVGPPVEVGSLLRVANCTRRAQFPSWSWIGWEGVAEFNDDNTMNMNNNADNDADDSDGDEDQQGDNTHVEFLMAMTSPSWATSINRIWSAEMLLYSVDGSASAVLQGNMPLHDFIDPTKKWLLTIKKPLVLRHLYLMRSRDGWEWRRLMGKLVELHLSVAFTEEELAAGHKSGDLVTALVFVSTVPFVWDGRAQFLILRKEKDSDGNRWERIGRLILRMEEHVMVRYKNSQEMVNDLPVRSFGRDLTLG